jgi:hypothetical protein
VAVAAFFYAQRGGTAQLNILIMITYKVGKTFTRFSGKCNSRFNCWDTKTKKVTVKTKLKCACCRDFHTEVHYLCSHHAGDPIKFLPLNIFLEVRRSDLLDPIGKLF